MALAIRHVRNMCLAPTSTNIQKKHKQSKSYLHFNVIIKHNPPPLHTKQTPSNGIEDGITIMHKKLSTAIYTLGNVPCI